MPPLAILFSLQRRETSGEAKRAARRMGRGFSPSLHSPRGSLRRSERLHAGYHPIESTYVLSNPFLSKLSFGSETIPQSAQFLLVTRHFFLLFRAMREWRRRPLWSWGLLSLDSFLHLTFPHVIRPSLFSLTLKTKTFKKRPRQLKKNKKLKARKRIYERGSTEIWLAKISDSQCALEWFSASCSFRAILWKPVQLLRDFSLPQLIHQSIAKRHQFENCGFVRQMSWTGKVTIQILINMAFHGTLVCDSVNWCTY